jgi:hypothetical protein
MIYIRKILALFVVAISVFLPFSVSLVNAQVSMQNEINWVYDYPTGMKKAQAENKPVMIFIYEEWCPRCRYMDQTTFTNHDVVQQSTNFINIKVIGTQQGTLYNYTVPPLVVFADPNGNLLVKRNTELSAGDVLELQRNVLASAPFPGSSGAVETSVTARNAPQNSVSPTADKKGLAIPGFDAILAISAFVSIALVASKYRLKTK